MLVRPQLEYASEVWSPYTMKCIKKIEQIQRNSPFMNTVETLTPFLINRLNLDSLYARRLIQQATMFYKIHYNLVDICPPSYIQHANHISSRTDHPLKNCNKNPLQINAYKYSFFPCIINILNHLPCWAVSHVIPSVDNFHKFAIPAIRFLYIQGSFLCSLLFSVYIKPLSDIIDSHYHTPFICWWLTIADVSSPWQIIWATSLYAVMYEWCQSVGNCEHA